MKDTVFDGVNWFVPFDWGNSSILYRTDLVDPEYVEEESWSILLDDRYKGRMAVFDSVDAIAGLLVGAADPFNMTDAELVEARKVLEKIHGNIRFWWTEQSAVEHTAKPGYGTPLGDELVFPFHARSVHPPPSVVMSQ